ncbi:MAG: hypothetical protein KF745_12905 [Phycisphaeraceae bacterium]|nr:hypothetical protein [Phycisphaeraceae bacterium]
MARPLRTATICLLLGAITTILIAWSRPWWPALERFEVPRPNQWPIDVGPEWPAAPASISATAEIGLLAEFASSEPFPWSDRSESLLKPTDADPKPGTTRPNLFVRSVTYGFPFPCLSIARISVLSQSPAAPERIAGGWRVAAPGSRWAARTDGMLPVHPLWSALALNIAFYTALIAAVWLGPGVVRRKLRSRRGLCTACGYPIGAAKRCTECGEPVHSRGHPPWTSSLRATLICFLLGAVTTVLVAWSCLWWPPMRRSYASHYTWPIDPGPEWPTASDPTEVETTIGSRNETALGFGDAGVLVVSRKTWGFPFPCLSMASISITNPQRNHRTGTVIGEWHVAPAGWIPQTRGVLPTSPAWPAFFINTAFFATFIAALAMGPGTIRRTRRTRRTLRSRRGLCTACGYPIGTAKTCTECGSPVSHEARRTQMGSQGSQR